MRGGQRDAQNSKASQPGGKHSDAEQIVAKLSGWWMPVIEAAGEEFIDGWTSLV